MNKRNQYQLIDQAFLPAKEIEIPQLFSGRKEEIVQGLHALRSPGASIRIYGKRGVGKSSIAKQLRLVALAKYKGRKQGISPSSPPEVPLE